MDSQAAESSCNTGIGTLLGTVSGMVRTRGISFSLCCMELKSIVDGRVPMSEDDHPGLEYNIASIVSKQESYGRSGLQTRGS